MLDSDYLTMLSSSDKLMSGEFEALERLQAELDLFDDPNRPEEIVEQMAVENHIDLIEEEVCSDTGETMTNEEIDNLKADEESEEEFLSSDQPQTLELQHIKEIKTEPMEEEHVVTLKQTQQQQQPEIVTVQSATKRSAPPSTQGNQQSKKPVI